MQIENSFELLSYLKNLGYLKDPKHHLWWPNSGNLEVIAGAILVQNSRWEQVERALEKLRKRRLFSFHALSHTPINELMGLIKDVGLYKSKAERLQLFCQNAQEQFGTFEEFRDNVERSWLLSQKGIGPETCDSILCYACFRDEMIASKYAYKLLSSFGYTMSDYFELKEWLEAGILAHLDEVYELYGYEIPIHKIFARFHGKIVEYGKEHNKRKE